MQDESGRVVPSGWGQQEGAARKDQLSCGWVGAGSSGMALHSRVGSLQVMIMYYTFQTLEEI